MIGEERRRSKKKELKDVRVETEVRERASHYGRRMGATYRLDGFQDFKELFLGVGELGLPLGVLAAMTGIHRHLGVLLDVTRALDDVLPDGVHRLEALSDRLQLRVTDEPVVTDEPGVTDGLGV